MATSLNTAATQRKTEGMVGALNRQWGTEFADTLHSYGDWISMTGAEAMYFLQSAPAAVRDSRFHFMLRCAVGGDLIAERLLLQTFLPKAVRFAHTCRGLLAMTAEDALCSAVAAMWESIRTYKLTCTKSVTGNLVMRALRLITTEYPAQDRGVVVEVPSEIIDESCEWESRHGVGVRKAGAFSFHPIEFDSGVDKVMAILAWASECGALSPREVKILGTYSTLSIAECKDWAEREGRSYQSLCNQVSNLRSKLARAIKRTSLNRGAW